MGRWNRRDGARIRIARAALLKQDGPFRRQPGFGRPVSRAGNALPALTGATPLKAARLALPRLGSFNACPRCSDGFRPRAHPRGRGEEPSAASMRALHFQVRVDPQRLRLRRRLTSIRDGKNPLRSAILLKPLQYVDIILKNFSIFSYDPVKFMYGGSNGGSGVLSPRIQSHRSSAAEAHRGRLADGPNDGGGVSYRSCFLGCGDRLPCLLIASEAWHATIPALLAGGR